MKIPKRIASVIINSLKGGVVPRIGLPYITVGRETEIDALLHDVDIIQEIVDTLNLDVTCVTEHSSVDLLIHGYVHGGVNV